MMHTNNAADTRKTRLDIGGDFSICVFSQSQCNNFDEVLRGEIQNVAN